MAITNCRDHLDTINDLRPYLVLSSVRSLAEEFFAACEGCYCAFLYSHFVYRARIESENLPYSGYKWDVLPHNNGRIPYLPC